MGQRIPVSSDRRMPVARKTAMIAASRRCANVLPRHALASAESSLDQSPARARRRYAHGFKTVLRRHPFVIFGVVPHAVLL